MEFTDQILDNKCHIILILLTGNSITSAKVYNHIHFQDRSDNFYNNQLELFTNGNKMIVIKILIFVYNSIIFVLHRT